MKSHFVSLALSYLVGFSTAVPLTEESLADLSEGKAVFVKFCKSSDTACSDISPVWNELALKYKGDDKFLVGSVDCDDDENDFLCEEYLENETLPHTRYGTHMLENEYKGELDLKSLSNFVEGLTIPCSLAHRAKWCNAEENEMIAKFRAMPMDQLEKHIDEMNEAFEVQYEEAESRIEAMESALKMKKKELKDAKVSGDETRIKAAQEGVKNAAAQLQEEEDKYDALLDKDQPVSLTLMEDIQDERMMEEDE